MNNVSRVVAIVGVALLVFSSMSTAKERGERIVPAAHVTASKIAPPVSSPNAPATPAAQKRPVAPVSGPGTTVQAATEPTGTTAAVPSSPLTGEQIDWSVIASGGNRGTSTNYILDATVGQTAAGPSTSTNYKLNAGFWQNFVAGCCVGTVGNVDCSLGDGVDIGDLTALIDNLFVSFTPLCCVQEANCDGDPANSIDIGDLTALIDNLFVTFTPLPGCQ